MRMTRHRHRTIRHSIAIRRLEVLSAQRMTPHLQRITLQGESLRGFVSASPDDVKLLFPDLDEVGHARALRIGRW